MANAKDFNVSATLKVIGGPAAKAEMQGFGKAIEDTGKQANAAQPALASFAGTLGTITGTGVGGGGNAAAILSSVSAGLTSIAGTAAVAAGAIAAVVVGVTGLAAVATARVLAPLIEEGVEFNSMLELNRLGITAMLVTFREWHDETGRVLQSQEAMAAAGQESVRVQQLLKNAAFDTVNTFEGLALAYQRVIVGASTQKATSEEIVRFTATLSNYASITGKSLDNLAGQASRAFLGISRSSGEFGGFIRGLGVDQATLKSWVAAGIAVQELQKRMEGLILVGPDLLATWKGVTSGLLDVRQQASGALTESIFDVLKVSGHELLGLFIDIKDGHASMSRGVMDAARLVGSVIGGVFGELVTMVTNILSDIGSRLSSAKEGWAGAVADFGISVVEIVGWIGQAVNKLSAGEGPFSTLMQYLKGWASELMEFWARIFDQINKTSLGNDQSRKAAATLHAESLKMLNESINAGLKQVEIEDRWRKTIDETTAAIVHQKEVAQGKYDALLGGVPPNDGSPRKANGEDLTDAIKALDDFQRKLRETADVANRSGLDQAFTKINYDATHELEDLAEKVKAAGKGAAEFSQGAAVIAGQTWRYQIDALDDFLDRSIKDLQKAHAQEVKEQQAYEQGMVDLQVHGYEDAASHAEAALAKEIEQIRKGTQSKIEILSRGLALEEALRGVNGEKIRRLIEERGNAEAAATERASYAIQGALALRNRDFETYYANLVAEAVRGGAQLETAQIEAAKKAGQVAYEAAVSGAQGIQAGVLQIQGSLQTSGQAISDFYVSTWGSMVSGFEAAVRKIEDGSRSFSDVIGGVLDGIKAAFAKMIAKMIEDWLFGKKVVEQNSINGRTSIGGGGGGQINMDSDIMGGSGATAGAIQGAAGVVGTAGQGYGYGSAIGGASGAPGWSGGASAGGTIGAILGTYVFPGIGTVLGAVIGAIIGGIVGIFVAPNTEKHISGAFSDLLTRAVTNGSTEAGRKIIEAQTGQVFDMFRDAVTFGQGTSAGANELAKAYRDSIATAFRGAHFEVSAGSDEDLARNFDYVMKVLGPKMALQGAFGQVGFGPVGNRDAPGGQAGLDYWRPGMDLAGNWEKGAQQLYDPNAPIPKFLTGLGFTAGKVAQLAKELAGTSDPTAFLKSLTDVVHVVVTWRSLIGDLQKDQAGVYADMTKEASQSPAEGFARGIELITQQVLDIVNYSGDEQIKKANEVGAAIQQLRDAELQKIAEIRNAESKVDISIESQRASMRDFNITPEEVASRNRQTIEAVWGAILNAKTVNDIETAVGDAQRAVQGLFDTIVANYKRLWAIRDSIASLTDTMKSWQETSAEAEARLRHTIAVGTAGAMADSTPEKIAAAGEAAVAATKELFGVLVARFKELAALQGSVSGLAGGFMSPNATGSSGNAFQDYLAGMADLRGKINTAATSSGDAQVKAIHDVESAATSMYEKQKALLAQIQANVESMGKSFDQQRFDVRFAQMDPQQQAKALLDQVRALQSSIPGMTDPAKIKETTDEIQALLRQYFGLFKADDPNRAGAGALVTQILDQVEATAKGVYLALQKTIDASSVDVGTRLNGLVTTIGNVMTDLKNQIDSLVANLGLIDSALVSKMGDLEHEVGQLTNVLKGLRETADGKFQSLVQDILDENAPLWAAMKLRLGEFTDAVQTSGDLFDDHGHHIGPDGDQGAIDKHTLAVNENAGAIGAMTTAAVAFVNYVSGAVGAGGGPGAGKSQSTIINTLKFNPLLLQQRFGRG